jgi:hypothetical protein
VLLRPAAYVAAALSALVIVGCDGGVEPSAPPTSEPALTTATATPDAMAETSEAEATTAEPAEAGPPKMPEEAREQTEAGAEAFVLHYFAELNEARSSGDTNSLQKLSESSCASCKNFAESASVGGLAPLEHEVVSASMLATTAVVEVKVTDSNSSGTVFFDLAAADEGWKVATVKAEQ